MFNPNEKINIYNQLPEKYWPYKRGQEVYYFRTNSNYAIDKGTVRWFNPAYESSMLITKGDPIVTIQESGDVVSLKDVKPATKSGFYELMLIKLAKKATTLREHIETLKRIEKSFRALSIETQKAKPKNYRVTEPIRVITLEELKEKYNNLNKEK